jgi:hypothetical protein
MDLVKGDAGPVSYDLELVEGKLKISVGSAKLEGVEVALAVSVDASHFLDKLKGIIPGTIDDAVIDALKAAFLK